MEMKITFCDYYTTEHNTLMKALIRRLQGVEIFASLGGDIDGYMVNADEVAASILKQLSQCEMFLAEEV